MSELLRIACHLLTHAEVSEIAGRKVAPQADAKFAPLAAKLLAKLG